MSYHDKCSPQAPCIHPDAVDGKRVQEFAFSHHESYRRVQGSSLPKTMEQRIAIAKTQIEKLAMSRARKNLAVMILGWKRNDIEREARKEIQRFNNGF